MENTEKIKKEDKIIFKKEKAALALSYFTYFVLGILMARAKILNAPSLIALCVFCVCPAPFYVPALFGTAIGYLSLFSGAQTVRLILCTAGLACARGAYQRCFHNRRNIYILPSALFFCSLSTGTAILISSGFSLKEMSILILKSACAFILCMSADFVFAHKELSCPMLIINKKYGFCLLILLSSLLCGLEALFPYVFSPALILLCLLSLLILFIYGEGQSVIFSLLCGTAMGIVTSFPSLGIFVGLCSFFSSFFISCSRAAAGFAFTFFIFLGAIIFKSGEAAGLCACAGTAALIFMTIPKGRLIKIKKRAEKETGDFSPKNEKALKACRVFCDLGERMGKVSQQLRRIEEEKKKLSGDDSRDISGCENMFLRDALTDSFFNFSNVLGEISFEEKEKILKQESAEIIKSVKECEINAGECICILKDNLKRQVKIEIKTPLFKEELGELCEEIEKRLDSEFFYKGANETKSGFCIVFEEKLRFSAEIGSVQKTGGDSLLCGDFFETEYSDDKILKTVLSDGMGTGGRAAVDSAVAVKLFLSLTGCGISQNTALKIINSAILSKSGEETLATIDVSLINPYSGKAEILKAGAAPSFLYKDNELKLLFEPSLPAGIIRDIEFKKTDIKMSEGDILLMLSDGAFCNDPNLIEKTVALHEGSMQSLAEKIAEKTREMQKNERTDDLSIIAIRLNKTK